MQNLDVKSDKITVGVAAHSDPQIKNNKNSVGATSSRPHFEGITLKNQKGITLIALIITIIVMLILVGVTINVALNGGLFSKAEEAGAKTKIAQIKEALAIKKAELVAENNGVEPEYTLTISDLSLPEELKTEYESKLKISTDGKLYYDASVVTNEAEQSQFKEMGMQEYVEINTGELANSYTFTIADIMKIGSAGTDMTRIIPVDDFWPENVSDELKNSAFDVDLGEAFAASNLTCSDSRFSFPFAAGGSGSVDAEPWSIRIFVIEEQVYIMVEDDSYTINYDTYIGLGYENLAITISMPE